MPIYDGQKIKIINLSAETIFGGALYRTKQFLLAILLIEFPPVVWDDEQACRQCFIEFHIWL